MSTTMNHTVGKGWRNEKEEEGNEAGLGPRFSETRGGKSWMSVASVEVDFFQGGWGVVRLVGSRGRKRQTREERWK